MSTSRSWRNPTILRLGWISFWADVCSEMAYPVLPLLVTRTLGLPLAFLGFVEGIAEFSVSCSKGLGGFQSDKRNSRVGLIRFGYGLSAIAKPLIGFLPLGPIILTARVTDRIGKGLRNAPRDAMIAECVEKEHLGRAFGWHRMMDNGGAVVGILLTLLLLYTFSGKYALIFMVAGVPGLIAVMLTFFLKEHKPATGQAPTFSWRFMTRDSWVLVLTLCCFAFGNTSDTFLIQLAFGETKNELLAVAAYAALNFAYAFAAYPAGWLSDRLNPLNVLRGGFILYAITYVLLGMTSAAGLFALFVVYGLQVGATRGATFTIIGKLAREGSTASILGLFYMLTGFATLLGNVVFGRLADVFGLRQSLMCCAIPAVLAFLLSYRVKGVAAHAA